MYCLFNFLTSNYVALVSCVSDLHFISQFTRFFKSLLLSREEFYYNGTHGYRDAPILLEFHIPLHLGTLSPGAMVLSLGIVLNRWGLLVSASVHRMLGVSCILQGVLTCISKFQALP